MIPDYNVDHAIAVAAQQVKGIPADIGTALVHLLNMQRRAVLGPEDFIDLNIAIKHLQRAVAAPDALAIEEAAQLCHSE